MSLNLFFNVLRVWRRQWWMLLFTILGMISGTALGQEEQRVFGQPEIAARAAVLMNPATGEILFSKEPHLRLPPASTTKILTALVILEHLDPNARILVSPQAASAPPSRIGLHAGEAVLTQDLLYGLLLKSGNDAAETLAEGAGGSIYGFAELMNAKAEQIGAHDSHFMNPHGLPNEDHYSTAYDLALIFRQAMTHPLLADIVRTRSAALRIEAGNSGPYGDNWRMVPVQSHNRLLASYEGARGGKTGFTLKARHCFVGEVDRGGVRLVVAILNSPNRGVLWQDARTLLDYGFARYGLASPPPMQPEPRSILVRRSPVADPDDEDRVIAARPAVDTHKPKITRVVMSSAKSAVSPRQAIAKTNVVTKTTIAKATTAKPDKRKTVVDAAKPVAGKTAVGKTAAGKATATAKPNKRETAKVAAARPEPTGSKQPQKVAKR